MSLILTWRRQLLVAICLLLSVCLRAQSSAGLFVRRYPVQQQRLLTILTGQYLFAVNQGQLDADSAMLYSCRNYGVSRLLPYNEAYYFIGISRVEAFLNAGNVAQAVALEGQLKGDDRLRLWCELAAYYLSKPGAQKPDMDSAFYFIRHALEGADIAKSCIWQGESRRLLGRYYFAAGNMPEASSAFEQAEKVLLACNNEYGIALTWQQRGECQRYNGPDKVVYLQKALVLFQKLGVREKEIEIISDLLGMHLHADLKLAEADLSQLLKIEKEIGFKHSMHTYDVQAFLAQLKGEHVLSMKLADTAMRSIAQTGDSVLFTFVNGRRAKVYGTLHKYDEAIYAYRQVVDKRHNFPQMFWYKQFLTLANLMVHIERVEQASVLIDSVEREFPATVDFDKMHLMIAKGNCYHYMGRLKEAAIQFKAFDKLASRFPPEYTYAELPEAYLHIALFYADIHNYTAARNCMAKASRFPLSKTNIVSQAGLHLLQSKLDSADGKYESALQHFIAFKALSDSLSNINQRKQIDELLVRYATEKKEQDITVLKQQASLHQVQIKQSNLVKNVTLGSILLLLIITGLLYSRYRIRQRTSRQLHVKNLALQQLVDEKEWLVKEIHHRVKNNLQTIVSLLESQAAYLQDDALLALQDSQNRVYAMSLMHQKLYQTERMVSISMNRYLPELVTHLKDSFNIGETISFQQHIEEVEIDVSQAIPIGLILNEAITNSIKYAFVAGAISKKISIVMHKQAENSITLTVSDNGKGLPADFDGSRVSSLGMRLMKGLTEDINGIFRLWSENGVHVSVIFQPNAILKS